MMRRQVIQHVAMARQHRILQRIGNAFKSIPGIDTGIVGVARHACPFTVTEVTFTLDLRGWPSIVGRFPACEAGSSVVPSR